MRLVLTAWKSHNMAHTGLQHMMAAMHSTTAKLLNLCNQQAMQPIAVADEPAAPAAQHRLSQPVADKRVCMILQEAHKEQQHGTHQD
jgi:hypothetical protein